VLRTSCTRRRDPGPDWTPPISSSSSIAQVREQVGDGRCDVRRCRRRRLAVAAALVQRAVGDQLTCVFVDHGLLRKGEREQVKRRLRRRITGIRLVVVDAASGS
jgi:GMP synthase (glutamine-hydrolysing)